MDSWTAVVLAAGSGQRMHSQTPKVLHRVAGRTLLEHVVRAARDVADELITVVPRDDEAFRQLLSDYVTFVNQEMPSGPAPALALAQDVVATPHVLVLNGDTPLLR